VSIQKLIISLVVLSLIIFPVFGEVSKTGTTAAKFLSFGVGPRAIAMGSAFTSISNDATAMYWNPAGIAFIDRNQVVFSQTKWILDININYIGLVVPAGDIGVFGVNVTSLSMNDMEVTTELNPEGTGEMFSAGSYSFGFSYARQLYENFTIGFNMKYIREDISKSSAQGFAVDIGTLFNTPFWGIKFSTNISNFGTKLQMTGDDLRFQNDPDEANGGNNESIDAFYSTDAFELPLRLQIGIARDFQIFEGQRFTLSVDAAHPNDNSEYVNFGTELSLLNEMVFLRGGLKSFGMTDREENFTLGAGFRYGELEYLGISLDYAFQNFIHLGDVHTFGFILNF